MPSKTITYYGIVLEVFYSKSGKHLPATSSDPEEFPEVSITSIQVEDVNIQPIVGELYQDEIYDTLFTIIMDEEN